ncbi:MAG: 3-oxoacyl-[acyl-carrier-protein] synthase III C-terminal domain-containing protein [Bacteriovoracaceae bacterium]
MNLVKPFINIKILGAATALPKVTPLTNLDIFNLHPLTKLLPDLVKNRLAQSIVSQYGYTQRYMIRTPGKLVNEIEASSETLAKECVQNAFKQASKNIDFFIHGTTTTTRYSGSQATAVLHTINQKSPAIEMKAGCSTSLASLYMGISTLALGHKNVMVNCAETLSKLVNPTVKETWFGLADASAALWLEKSEQETQSDFKVLGMIFGTNGEHVDMYTTQGKLPPNQKDMDEFGYTLSGNGSKLKSLAQEHYKLMFSEFKKEFGSELENISYVIPHQVNFSLVKNIIKKNFNLPNATILRDSDQIGNVGGSSVLFTLVQSIQKKSFKKGDKILLMSVGGGLTYCMQLWEKV